MEVEMSKFTQVLLLVLTIVFVIWFGFWGVDWLYNRINKQNPLEKSIPTEIESSPALTSPSQDSLISPIKIYGQIDEKLAIQTIAAIHRLAKDTTIQEIQILIDSEGGTIQATFLICYAIQIIKVKKPIRTIVTGQALSGAGMILSSGTKYRRFAVKDAKIMIHRPWCLPGWTAMRAEDLEEEAKIMRLVEELLYDLISENTGQPIEKIKNDLERELWLTPQRAIEYGLIDSLFEE